MKIKKLTTCVVIILLVLGGLQAQQGLHTTGGDATGSGGSVSYSIGHVVYTTHSGTTGTMAQGVQHAYEILITTGIEETYINLEVSAYPNPTTDFLHLKIENNDYQKLSYQLYDLQGRLLQSDVLTNHLTTINMENLPGSTYFLSVSRNQKILKTFQITKN
jgi:hypothetical protein